VNGGLLKTESIAGLILSRRFHDHSLEQDLERHGVPTSLVGDKKFAITLKNAVVVCDNMVIIVAVERQLKLVEAKTRVVFCISFRFFQFADQAIIHGELLLKKDKQKGTQ